MLATIHEKHKDRYRIQFCNENFYLKHLNTFKMWKSLFRDLSPVDKLQAWVLGLSCLRRPTDWYGGPRPLSIRAGFSYTHALTISDLFSGTEIRRPSKISSSLNIFDFLNSYRVKALPETCFRSLCFIVDDHYPLDLVDGEVQPLELLKIQISGRRVVALNERVEEWAGSLYAGRDYLGFILHDLIHADHFFSSSVYRAGQLGFYKFALAIFSLSSVQKLLEDSKFKEGFEYIISDMNSHPLHLFQTLHSLLFSVLRNDARALEIWNEWVAVLNLEADEALALALINSKAFNYDYAKTVEGLCQRLGA
jgi:hypothetical protein